MAEELETIKNIVTIALPFVKPLVETLVKPKLEKLARWLKKKDTDGMVEDYYFYENKFEEYLTTVYEKCSIINTLVFPNQQIEIKKLYYPLTIRCSKDSKDFKIDSFKKSLVKKYRRILISDNAGMGKSTLSKYFCLSVLEENYAIPVFIELRRLSDQNRIIDEIFNQLDPIDQSFDRDFVLRLLKDGEFMIFLDGYDEIPVKDQESVTQDLKDFISKAGKNCFILTSRPEASLSSFGEFQLFCINSLGAKESNKLIKKYDAICKKSIGDNLIKEINEGYSQVKEFLSNPFLVSLLYKSYSYNKDIPSKKSTFYEEVYTALYKEHDLSKDTYKRPKFSNLDIYNFRLVLRELAFATSKLGEVEYTEPKLVAHIDSARKRLASLEFKSYDFFRDLLLTVPLFHKDGTNVKWAHKSIQDYFAAEFICFHPQKEKIFQELYSPKIEKYFNVADLLYELDFRTFRKTIIYNLIKEYIDYFDKSYQDIPGIGEKDLELRRALTFGIKLFVINFKNRHPFMEYRELLEKKYPESRNENLNFMPFVGVLICFHTSFLDDLKGLLRNKRLRIFNTAHDCHEEAAELKKELDFDHIEKITDNPQSIYNSNKSFGFINKVLTVEPISRGLVLDYKKCLEMKEEIDKEIQRDEEQDVLDGF